MQFGEKPINSGIDAILSWGKLVFLLALLGLAERVDTRSIRSVIFTPPYYQVECLSCPPRGYIITNYHVIEGVEAPGSQGAPKCRVPKVVRKRGATPRVGMHRRPAVTRFQGRDT